MRLFGFLREAIEEARARAQVLELDSSTNTNIVVQAYSSDLAAAERKSILEKFKAREIHMYVVSYMYGECLFTDVFLSLASSVQT